MLIGIVITAMVMAGYLRSLEGVKNVEHGRAMALATFTVTGGMRGGRAQPTPHPGRLGHLGRHDRLVAPP